MNVLVTADLAKWLNSLNDVKQSTWVLLFTIVMVMSWALSTIFDFSSKNKNSDINIIFHHFKDKENDVDDEESVQNRLKVLKSEQDVAKTKLELIREQNRQLRLKEQLQKEEQNNKEEDDGK